MFYISSVSSRLLLAVELISRKLQEQEMKIIETDSYHPSSVRPHSRPHPPNTVAPTRTPGALPLRPISHTHTRPSYPPPSPCLHTPLVPTRSGTDAQLPAHTQLINVSQPHISHLSHNLNPFHSGTTWSSLPLFFLHLEFTSYSFIKTAQSYL